MIGIVIEKSTSGEFGFTDLITKKTFSYKIQIQKSKNKMVIISPKEILDLNIGDVIDIEIRKHGKVSD